jgi:eukaryotic-like serine/threonine-protein kinase
VWPWVLVVVALALAGLGVAWASGVWKPATPEPQLISVPDVTNLSQAQATDQLQRDGFTIGRVTLEYSALAEGNVTSQTPPPHSMHAKLTRVSLVVSKGPQPVAVPDILGKTEAEAIAILGDAGFKASAAPSVFSKTVKEGKVASQTPAPLTKQPPGATITYTLSKGAKKIEVPDVIGKSESGATSALKRAGFRVNIVPDFSDTVARGYVSDQDHAAGGLYPPKEIVTITVSKGAGVLVPNTVANTWADAKTLLSPYGLVIDPSADTSGTVQSQDPTAGTRVVKGTTVHLTF